MSALLRLFEAELAIGNDKLLDNATFQVATGERVCLVGRNGAGKSTLMKVLSGEVALDNGKLIVNRDLRLACLEQDPPKGESGSVFDYVAEGISGIGELLKDYFHQTQRIAEHSSQVELEKLQKLQTAIDSQDGWRFEQRINQVLSRLQLMPDMRLEKLSGGWLRKVALAKALVGEPDVLLLDEPTNHLDIDSIRWLEEFLKSYQGVIIFISHDRFFIKALATRIVDLDRGVLESFPGDYQLYLESKAELLRVEEEQNAAFDKKLAEEETWIRQGIKARRTRNEGRVRALKQLRKQRKERRSRQGNAQLSLAGASQSGKLVFDVEALNYAWKDKQIVRDFTSTVMRGDKVALIGPNGCGKTTLLNLLLGKLKPDQGKTKQGVNLEVAYFDQYREQLDENKSVVENVGEGKVEVSVAGSSRHILGYLQDFLFSPKRARTPLRALSGGEKNRVLLAKLFLKSSNVLILDEPTNDLDIETLELLEELLANEKRTILLVSHDREFVNNTVDYVWHFDGKGTVNEIVGGYDDALSWIEQQQDNIEVFATKNSERSSTGADSSVKSGKKKLSYKLQRELEGLPEKIEQLEQQLQMLQQRVNQPEFFKESNQITQPIVDEMNRAEVELTEAFERWDELEAMQNH